MVLRQVMALPDPHVTAAPQVTGLTTSRRVEGRVYGTVVVAAGGRSRTATSAASVRLWVTLVASAAMMPNLSTHGRAALAVRQTFDAVTKRR
jgi:hypothetical protein